MDANDSIDLCELRAHELRTVVGWLRAVTGSDRAVVLRGEPGIGKTYLAHAAVDRLTAEGFRVAWGRADAVERAVPYAAIAQVLAGLPGDAPAPVWQASRLVGPDAVFHEVV